MRGSPSLILMVLRISFGITTLPRSSILRTIPVAFIYESLLVFRNYDVSICKTRGFILKKTPAVFSQAFFNIIYFFASVYAVIIAVIGMESITPMLLEIPLITSIERNAELISWWLESPME